MPQVATSPTSTARVCFATLLTTDSYLHGALTLAASLRATGTTREILCLVADGQLSKPALARLELAFDRVVSVPILDTEDKRSLALLGRLDLGSTVTKIGVWSLTEYERVVFLDADTLVLRSIDSLLALDNTATAAEAAPDAADTVVGCDSRPNGGMHNEGLLGAAPDLGWPDCFNSGVFVARPSPATHRNLLNLLAAQGSFDGGDQGLLNTYFSDWSRADHTRRLPFAYNTTSTSFYTYAPAFVRFSHSIRVVHFVGPHKPWSWSRAANGSLVDTSSAAGYEGLVEKWWAFHDMYVSFWSPEKEPYDRRIALSPSGHFNRASSSADKETDAAMPELQPASASSSHALDGAWKREGSSYSLPSDRDDGDDSWGSFTPAPDFALTPRAPASRRSSSTGAQ